MIPHYQEYQVFILFSIFLLVIAITVLYYHCVRTYFSNINKQSFKVFLDDERLPVQEGWIVCKTAEDFFYQLETIGPYVEEWSFDHDIGSVLYDGSSCLRRLLFAINDDSYSTRAWKTKTIYLHSDNTEGIWNMTSLVNTAKKIIPGTEHIELIIVSSLNTKGWAYIPDK